MSALHAVEPAERATVIYCRISSDRHDGAGATLGVRRQEAECRAFASFLDLGPVARVYVDNDKSASEGKYRPAWEDLLEDVEQGRVGVLIAWHFDRLTRNDRDLTRLLNMARDHGVKVRLKTSGDIDVSTASGRMMARQQAMLAVYEVEHQAERMTSKHKELAQDGKPNGGRRRFGFNDDMTHREPEATIVRDMAKRLLAGESLSSLARWLNEEGVRTIGWEYDQRRIANGQEPKQRRWDWHPNVLRTMLTSPHLIGARSHHGDVVKADAWQPIIDRDTWAALQRLLTAPERKTYYHGNSRAHLLSGLIRCATCDTPCRVGYSGKSRKDGSRCRTYGCPVCVKRRSADHLDLWTQDAVIALLERIDVNGLIAEGDDADQVAVLRAEVAEHEATLDGLADKVLAGTMTEAFAGRLARKSEAALTMAQQALALAEAQATDQRLRPRRVLDGVTGPNARTLWEGLALDRRRAIIDLLVDVRMVHAARQGDRNLTPETAIRITRKPLG